MKTTIEVSCIGTLWTITDFKRKGGPTIRIKVGFKQVCSIVNQYNYYIEFVYLKGFKCRNFIQQPTDTNPLEYISEQELYEAYYQHWCNLNPLKQFSKLYNNGYYENFTVVGKVPEINRIKGIG